MHQSAFFHRVYHIFLAGGNLVSKSILNYCLCLLPCVTVKLAALYFKTTHALPLEQLGARDWGPLNSESTKPFHYAALCPFLTPPPSAFHCYGNKLLKLKAYSELLTHFKCILNCVNYIKPRFLVSSSGNAREKEIWSSAELVYFTGTGDSYKRFL